MHCARPNPTAMDSEALMSRTLPRMLLLLLGALTMTAHANCPPALDHTVDALASEETVNLCDTYKGKVLLVVNTASKCGFTPQYDGLEALHAEKQGQGFAVLGFPSNDFGGQEPGTEAEVAKFCRLTYGVQFPMFGKTHAAEANTSPFYAELARQAGEFPQWNFHKYLIDRSGAVVASFPSQTKPDDPELRARIDELLEESF